MTLTQARSRARDRSRQDGGRTMFVIYDRDEAEEYGRPAWHAVPEETIYSDPEWNMAAEEFGYELWHNGRMEQAT